MSLPGYQLSYERYYKQILFLTVMMLLVNIVGAQSIDLNRPVGMTKGVAGSSGGAAMYTLPIDVPAGIKGVQPKVSLTYTSQGNGNGYSGLGWSLSPVSAITRTGKNVFHNGIATPVEFTGSNDAFVLDGQRLMLVSGTNGAAGSVYGTEQEGFSKIEAMSGNGNSPDWFKVTTKNGTVLEYGSDNMKLSTASGTETVLWLLRRVTDASGNYILYSYSINTTSRYFSLSSISYTGNINTGTTPSYQVLFTYSSKADWTGAPSYISGEALFSANLLDRIDIKKADGTQIRSYTLAHQYLRKRYFLTSVTEAGANGTALNPVTFTYGKSTSGPEVTLMNEQGYTTNENYSGDFDGDGMSDVLSLASTYNSGTGETFYRWYQIIDKETQTTTQGKYVYHMDTDIPSYDVKIPSIGGAIGGVIGRTQGPLMMTDFDGDGKDDVFLAKYNKNAMTLAGVNINYTRKTYTGSPQYGYKKVEYNTMPSTFYGQHTLSKLGGSFFVSGDFDGDGHTDYILILGVNGYSNAYKAFFSSPSKGVFNEEILGFGQGVNGATGDFAANAVAESKSIVPINFDGDGKTELLVIRNEGSYVLRVMPIPSSSGYNYGSTVLYTTTGIKTDYRLFPGDFNGDGITDLFVRPSKDNAFVQWQIFWGTGKAYNVTQFAGERYRITLLGDGYSNGQLISVGDFDGDGKSEIWHSIDQTTSSSNHVIYYFNGTSFVYEDNTLSSAINTESAYSTGDYNGDGKPDFLKIRNASQTTFYGRFLLNKPFKEQNLLVSASNLGYQTNFDYGLLNNKDNSGVYSRTKGDYSQPDGSSPTPYIPDYIVPAPAMYVVSNIRRPNGIGYQSNEYYTYQDLIIHNSGRGALGFQTTDVRNDMNHVNRNWNELNLTYSTLYPWVLQVGLNGGGLLTRTRYDITFQSLSTGYQDKRYFMKQDRVFTHNWLTTEGQEVLNTYDNYGNVTQSIAKAGSTDDFNITSVLETATTTTTYGTYAGGPYPGFPTSTSTQKTRTGQPQVSKTTSQTYTTQGLPEAVTENAGTPIATTITNTYNSLGLPTLTVTNAPGVTTPVAEIVYDPTGRFVSERKLSGGGVVKKETFTYDDRWGVLLTKTSTDGLTTTYQYDEYGNLNRTDFPDGNAVTSTRSWETNNGYARFNIYSQRTDGSNPQKSYIDVLGREIKTEKRGFSNQWLTAVKNYNYYGQLSSETSPYYPGEQINYIYYYYDSYGRPSSTYSVTGSTTTTYSTSGGMTYTTQATNGLGQWTSKTLDASGKVVASSDNGSNMSFTYDSWGNQLTAGSNGQTFVSNVFDTYGRKSSTTDADASTINYEYNALGQLTKETDGNGNIHTTIYDVFGRIATATGPQGTTTYTYYYDAGSGKSNDNVTQVVGFSGDVQTYQYDNLQRVQAESITASGSSLTKSYTYDSRGNLSTTTYPAGFLIRNIYDDNDIVIQKKYEQGATVKTLFTATAMNSRGIYTGYNTGNGKSRAVSWDFNKEIATRYFTAGVQDLNLDYEANTTNLLSRRDAIRNLKEEFTYDIYDRLTSARVNGTQQFAITYDNGAQGKILQKTDIGNYNYNSSKPHALESLSAINPSGADPNSIIGTQSHIITYTPFLKTATVTENGYQLTYSYGSDQQRLTSEFKYNGATIESKSYWGNVEGLVKNGNTYEIYYIQAGNGLNNIIVKQNGAINIYYTYTDQLGSIVAVSDENGTLVAEQNFDAWGRKRNPVDWTYNSVPSVPAWLYRGFTGHEHIVELRLINMNGRMYDPMTGMMMSPDNYVANPWSPGGYNRYNYGNGNPFKFTDPSGEIVWFVPLIYAAVNVAVDLIVSKGHMNFGQIAMSAVSGAIGGLIGGGSITSVGKAFLYAGVSQLNRLMPNIPIYQSENFSIGISPMIGLGSSGFSFGASVNVSGMIDQNGDGKGFSYSGSLGFGYNSGVSSLGESVGKSTFWNASGFTGYYDGHANYGAGYTLTSFSGKAAQTTGAMQFQVGDFGFRLDNDFFAFSGDKFRTGGGLITYKINDQLTLAAGGSMMTGYGKDVIEGPSNYNNDRMPNRQGLYNPATEILPTLRAGTFYGGVVYRGIAYFAGNNSEKRLHNVQNWIHRKVVNSPYYPDRNRQSDYYHFIGGFNPNYLFY
ncbi:FG-GAP-like repeat-containing protein [Niabella hirudinis]|uniref:FG-GAP-like repeat-containing protein n=1 Tax=Niabella hirudinis TaxID=1285929 RepID=UPI003EC103CD